MSYGRDLNDPLRGPKRLQVPYMNRLQQGFAAPGARPRGPTNVPVRSQAGGGRVQRLLAQGFTAEQRKMASYERGLPRQAPSGPDFGRGTRGSVIRNNRMDPRAGITNTEPISGQQVQRVPQLNQAYRLNNAKVPFNFSLVGSLMFINPSLQSDLEKRTSLLNRANRTRGRDTDPLTALNTLQSANHMLAANVFNEETLEESNWTTALNYAKPVGVTMFDSTVSSSIETKNRQNVGRMVTVTVKGDVKSLLNYWGEGVKIGDKLGLKYAVVRLADVSEFRISPNDKHVRDVAPNRDKKGYVWQITPVVLDRGTVQPSMLKPKVNVEGVEVPESRVYVLGTVTHSKASRQAWDAGETSTDITNAMKCGTVVIELGLTPPCV